MNEPHLSEHATELMGGILALFRKEMVKHLLSSTKFDPYVVIPRILNIYRPSFQDAFAKLASDLYDRDRLIIQFGLDGEEVYSMHPNEVIWYNFAFMATELMMSDWQRNKNNPNRWSLEMNEEIVSVRPYQNRGG